LIFPFRPWSLPPGAKRLFAGHFKISPGKFIFFAFSSKVIRSDFRKES
jgi:hypothetical protein